jgi:multidrug efflux system outer membrane protein
MWIVNVIKYSASSIPVVQLGLSMQNASRALKDAVHSATRVYALTDARYQEGAANHLDLVLAEQTLLGYQRQELLNRGQQLLNAVQPVKALGAGWAARPQP